MGVWLYKKGIFYVLDYVINLGGVISVVYEFVGIWMCEGVSVKVEVIGVWLSEIF